MFDGIDEIPRGWHLFQTFIKLRHIILESKAASHVKILNIEPLLPDEVDLLHHLGGDGLEYLGICNRGSQLTMNSNQLNIILVFFQLIKIFV